MDEKFNAVVLRAANYRDNDKMLKLFTLEEGIVSACLRGVNRPNSKLKFAGELFCLGEFVLAEKSGRRTVIEVNQIDSFYALRLDSDKYCVGCAIVEFVSLTLLDGIKAYDLFLALIKALKILSGNNVAPKKVLVVFYLAGLKYLGYELNYNGCSKCGGELISRAFFSFGEGISVCADCAEARDIEIKLSTYELLKECSNCVENIDINEIENISASDQILTNAIKFLDYAIKENTGAVIKSHKMLF